VPRYTRFSDTSEHKTVARNEGGCGEKVRGCGEIVQNRGEKVKNGGGKKKFMDLMIGQQPHPQVAQVNNT
jgi:hypothetical protein